MARWYLQGKPVSVYSVGGCYKFPAFAEAGDLDNGMAIVKFENDSIFMLHAGRTCAHGYHTEMEIIGTEGSLRIANIPEMNLVTIYGKDIVGRECSQDYIERFDVAYSDELQEFVNCIIEDKRPEIGIDDGVMNTKIAYACRESQKTEKIVLIN